jgi:hypothetical protein
MPLSPILPDDQKPAAHRSQRASGGFSTLFQ